jgi:hypothetical protein
MACYRDSFTYFTNDIKAFSTDVVYFEIPKGYTLLVSILLAGKPNIGVSITCH